MKEIMTALLNHLIEASEEKAAPVQLVLAGQVNAIAGAVKHGPTEGIYSIRTTVQKAGNKELAQVDVHFPAETVLCVFTAVEERLVRTSSGIITPGASSR